MDRITRYARPHCYDASRGPLSFLDNGQRSRSSPRINVDSITRKACPERQPSDSAQSSSGFAGSRLRAQSTDSLTWRRAVALKSRQQVIAPRQHQSHAELRTDSSECLAGTVVVDFSNTQIGEPVFEDAKPLGCSTPRQALTNGNSRPDRLNKNDPADGDCVSINNRKEPVTDQSVEKRIGSKGSLNESKVRPVVETVAILGRRLSYSKAAGGDSLDPSDLDDIARQIGLIRDNQKPRKDNQPNSQTQANANQPSDRVEKRCAIDMDSLEQRVSPAIPDVDAEVETGVAAKNGSDARSRKSRMGWLGGLFRRLRHWPDSSSSSGESKKQRRRAVSLPPSKSRSNRSQASESQSPNSLSAAGESPPSRKKSSGKDSGSAKSSFRKRELCEQPVTGVSRSRTVDDMERARKHGIDDPELVLPQLDTTRVLDSSSIFSSERQQKHASRNGHVEASASTATEGASSLESSRSGKSSQPPSYCNLAILAYGYSGAFSGTESSRGDAKLGGKSKEANFASSSPNIKAAGDDSRTAEATQESPKKSKKSENPPQTEKVSPKKSKEPDGPPKTEEASPKKSKKPDGPPKTEEVSPKKSKKSDGPPKTDEASPKKSKESDGPPKTEEVSPKKSKESDGPPKTEEVSPKKSEESGGVSKPAEDEKKASPAEPSSHVPDDPRQSRSSPDGDSQPTNGPAAFIPGNTHGCVEKESSDMKVSSPCDNPVENESHTPTPRVKINVSDVDVVELSDDASPERKAEKSNSLDTREARTATLDTPDVVVRRKKVRTVSCSEAPDTVPRSSLIMLAVSQASPRPKTELVDAALTATKKSCPMSMSQHEDIVPSGTEEMDGFYFLRLAAQVETNFREKMTAIENDLVNDSDKQSEEVSGILRSVVGKANLLLTDKFAQLRGLCQQNISEQVDPAKQRSVALEGFATRNSDLEGYWALVQLQVDDIEKQFSRVDKLRQDGWQMPTVTVEKTRPQNSPTRPGVAKKKKKTPSSLAAGDSGKSPRNAQSQARLEARKRLENAKREAASKMKASAAQNHSDGDVLIFV